MGRQSAGTVFPLPVGHETLQVANGYGFAPFAHDALSLTLDLLGTHPAAYGGKRIFGPDVPDGTGEVALADQIDKPGNVHTHRTALHTTRLFALQASGRLFLGHGHGISQRNLFEVPSSDFWFLLGHRHAGCLFFLSRFFRHFFLRLNNRRALLGSPVFHPKVNFLNMD